jgi:hypothetical protein
MCWATLRQSQLRIKIVLLEGKPDQTHPLKGFVAALMLSAIDSYAVMLGCTEIEIQEPAAGAVPWYLALGFEFDTWNRLVMRIQR